MRSRTSLTVLLAVVGLALAPAGATASSGQLALFQDDASLVDSGDAKRQATLSELEQLGVDAIKVQLQWANIAPLGRRKPAGFDGSDPSQYPGWGRYDAFVSDAQARGFRVMFALSPPHPGWATKRRGDLQGPGQPNPREFRAFAEAAGKRFPTVDLWTTGNEPNHKGFLFPQSKRGMPVAPHVYREMVRGAVSGLRASGHGGDTILFGELLPIAPSTLGPKLNMKPLRFIREFFCLDANWRAFRGRAARRRGCNGYRKLTGVTGFGYHPYTRPAGPTLVEPSTDDATIRSLGRVTRALDIARRKGRVGGGRLPLWITEFGFQSNPPDRFSARIGRIPTFMGESELWLAFNNRRVKSYSQYAMTDTAIIGGDTGSWQSGLRFVDGRQKPGVYDAYRLPIFVRLLGANRVEVRGAARPGGAGAVVQVQQRRGQTFDDLGGPITVTNQRGYFKARFRLAGAAKRRFRFRYEGLSSPEVKALLRP
jgi:hypothetical protein